MENSDWKLGIRINNELKTQIIYSKKAGEKMKENGIDLEELRKIIAHNEKQLALVDGDQGATNNLRKIERRSKLH